jgi:CheY-like chemotaxis protein
LGPSVQLSISTDPLLWPALVDRNQIELVILNLAINARDAMPEGGSLAITLSNRRSDSEAPAGLAAGDYVVLAVSDTGIGMDEATLARAIEPFFTTKEIGKGTGLGLSTVHGIVAQSRGAMRIRSNPGHGTVIEIWLPRAQETPMPARATEGEAPERGNGTILLCEDDPTVRDFIAASLEDSGYQVVATEGGPSALAVLDSKMPVDLLLVDLAMPKMNGATVVHLAQERRPDLPALVITGNADTAPLGTKTEEVPVLHKPFKQAELVSRVVELLASRQRDRTSRRNGRREKPNSRSAITPI